MRAPLPSNTASANALRRAGLALLLLTLSAGCATTGAFQAGQRAERVEDFDLAVVEYTKALKEDPDNRDTRAALERARLRASQAHFQRGRRYSSEDRHEEALVEYQLASELNPTDGRVEAELKETRRRLRTQLAVSREGKTELQALIERTRDLPPPGLDLPAGAKLPESMIFNGNATSRSVFTAIARFADLNIVFDPSFRSEPLAIDLRNATLEDALASVTASTQTFYRMTAAKTLTIIPDTLAKRREYEEAIVRTFYLSNADIKEVTDLLRIVVDIRSISPITANNAIAIKDTPERIAAAGKLIAAIDKARPEVVIEVELLEVDRTRLKEYGIQVASPGSPGIDAAADINREGFTLHDLRTLSQSDVLLTGLPGLYFRLLKNDENTRTLATPRLRTSEGIAAQARFGERVPITVTQWVPIAAGGINTQPVESFVYENIGVNIDITPRTHHNDEVSLALKISVSNISGTLRGQPTFGNREISTTIRLRDGETNLLAGLIRDNERTVMNGVPGLSDLPLVGRLFASNHKESQQTDIILTLTPHIVRVLDLEESDLRPFRLGRDFGGTGTLGVAMPQVPRDPREDLQLPPAEKPPAVVPTLPFPQPLQGTLPGQPVVPPKKPGGGGW